MLARRENRCRRFQANVFNKSKCQNCFKPIDSHTLSESDLYGVRMVPSHLYPGESGYSCLKVFSYNSVCWG
uniref:Uncharacterized protein n=1 Tax=Electrophorus electricus TaxID=8005 RepID=A0A4W4DNF6_ELEEL